MCKGQESMRLPKGSQAHQSFVQNVSIALPFTRWRETVEASLTKAVYEALGLAESLLN
jgi:hypothetical protein